MPLKGCILWRSDTINNIYLKLSQPLNKRRNNTKSTSAKFKILFVRAISIIFRIQIRKTSMAQTPLVP